jgi:2-amino-4-hydroxy-6-hydroxymethyldihydropteridine diphosphokinase
VFIVLGLGSNKGNSRAILEAAVRELGKILTGIRVASLFETEPLYLLDQNHFLNTAVCGTYDASPYELLEDIHHIEAAFGRDRAKERRFGERTLDIDILTASDGVDDIVLSGTLLEIPHPRLRERAFALAPLLELLPDSKDPLSGEAYRCIFEKLPPQGIKNVDAYPNF